MNKLGEGKHFAPGIKDRNRYGDLHDLNPKDLVDYVLQRHVARRAGDHKDLRIGTPETDLFSWVTRKSLPEEGKSIGIFRQSLHDHAYKDFEGVIPPGYGAGPVTKEDEGKMLVTKREGNDLSLTRADRKNPERYKIVHPEERDWKHALLLKARAPKDPGVEKESYKSVPHDKIPEALSKIDKDTVVEPKVDGALALVHLLNHNLEIMSHRKSKTTGKNIVHTERVLGHRPEIDIPKGYNNSVLLGEMFGTREGKSIPPQELSGLLNSNIDKSLESQKSKHVDMKTMLFDIAKKQGRDTAGLSQDERRAALEFIIQHLPKDKFTLPPQARGPEEGMAMFDKIRKGNDPLTEEGVVIKPQHERPQKAKVFDERDVFIQKLLEGTGKYKGSGVGAFGYSLTPSGEVVGNVGSGLDDETRTSMYNNPEDYVGKRARIKAQGQFADSKAYRSPVYIAPHEG